MFRSLSWRVAILLSLIIHVSAGLFFYFFPLEKKEKGAPFVTRLVTPEELGERQPKPPEGPVARPRPAVPRSSPKSARPPMLKPSSPRPKSPSVPEMESRRTQQIPRPDSEGPRGDSGRGAPPVPGQDSTASKGQRGSEGAQVPLKPGDMRRSPAGPSLREKLFDREVLEKFAKKEEPKRDSTVTFDTNEFKYHTYMVRLKEKIESVWKYPPDAAMRGIYGDLYIQFTIKKNGMLSNLEVLRTSGHRSLDEAAQQALRDAQPFWPLPDEWGKDSLTITGRFVYSIYGAYIR